MGTAANSQAVQSSEDKDRELLRTVKTIRIVLEEYYSEADKIKLPFLDYSKKILRYAGYEVARAEARDFQATLSIKITGIPLREYYELGYKGYLYTGGKLLGNLLLETAEKTLYSDYFSYDISPPNLALLSDAPPKTPNNAPFMRCFREGFLPALFEMLGHIKGVESIVAAFGDEDDDIRAGATAALGRIKIGDTSVVEPLIDLLNDKNYKVRENAAEMLGKTRDPKATEPLIEVLKDEASGPRNRAAEALGRIQDSRAVEPLVLILKDEQSSIREIAAEALGMIKDSKAVEPLIEALGDKEMNVQKKSAWALGEIKDWSAIWPLIVTLAYDDFEVRGEASNALWKLTGQNFGIEASKWINWWKENKAKFIKQHSSVASRKYVDKVF
jgi:hypothetical protein